MNICRLSFFICLLTFSTINLPAQPHIQEEQKILYVDTDTLQYFYRPPAKNGYSIPIPIKRLMDDPDKTYVLNTNNIGWPGKHVFSTGGDSLVFESDNEQSFHFRVRNSKDTAHVYFNFVNSIPDYNTRYQKTHLGKVIYEVPLSFELTNILIALTDAGKTNDNLILKGTRYYQEVMAYFKNFDQHPIVKFLNDRIANHSIYVYYDARNWGFRYNIKNGKLYPQGTYPEQWGQNFWTHNRYELEDFIRKSKFEQFYKSHVPYYDSLIRSEKENMPVKKMWRWLEKEFPARYQSCRVIFSPLISSAHNTERYTSNGFTESLLFVCSTERIKETQPALLQGEMSGIVFTELDHNYVNPVSDTYKIEIEKIFSDRSKWVGVEENAGIYGNPLSVFNEYMTHALFCLYANIVYSPTDFEVINARRESLMIDRRKFIRFKDFNEELKRLYLSRKEGQTVADLYPALLVWVAKQ